MSHDLRYALRMLVTSPGFSMVAILTLALGIGANTAIFSVVHALLLRPLPYPEADRLVMVWQDFTARGGPATEWATPGNYFDWRNSAELFSGVAAVQGWQPSLTGAGDPEPLVGEQVTSEYFDVTRVSPSVGRGLRAEDSVPNAPRVVVLSHELWQRRFGGDRAVIGQSVRLAGEPHEVIGVMPAGFRPVVVTTAELWRPLRLNAANPSRGAIVLRVVARLRDGLSLEQARAAASTLARQLEQQYPEFNSRTGINLVSLRDQIVGDIRLGLLVLVGAVGFVLLIGCVNVANLLLARASARTREIAVRMALGAARNRVLRQLLTESVLLASIGGALGLLIAVWGVSGLVAIAPGGAPPVDEIGLNVSVLVFSIGLTLATGILFGLVPALQASHADVAPALREGGRGDSGPAGRSMRQTLIVVEVAVALVLLVGGGLLMRTLLRLQAFDLGFDPARVLVGFVAPPRAQYPTDASRLAFYDRLLERVSALPGVEVAALSSVIPLGGDSDMTVWIEGRPLPRTDADATTTWYRLVSADYLRAMSISVVGGRGLVPREAAPVVVVNETGARRFWPGENALGKRVRFGDGDDAPWFTVVGIAEDVRMRGARGAARTEMYLPYWQLPEPGINIVLKAAGDPHLLAGPLRQAVRDVDSDLPVASVAPMADVVSSSMAEPRFLALLVGAFATLALLLAGVGIYGVMSYAVAQRRAEIGVRMALGADPSDVFRLVVGDGVRVAGIGAMFGLLAALGLSRTIGSLLFGVEPQDPLTFGAMTAVLMAVAALASLIPAVRAMRVDPMVALRTE